MHVIWRDVVYGLRSLLRKPGFAATALVSLMLGIGTTTAIYTLLDAVFLRPLPLEDLDRLVAVSQTLRDDSGGYSGETPLSYLNYLDYAERARGLDQMAAYSISRVNLSGGSEPQRATGMYVTGNYFDLLGLAPEHGRLFEPDDDREASRPVAVLSYGCWLRLFGADEEVLGRQLEVNGESLTVVGVAPRGFRGTELQFSIDVFVPATKFERLSPYRAWFRNRSAGLFTVIGRLTAGTSPEQATRGLLAVSRQLAEEYPDLLSSVGAQARPLVASTIAPRLRGRYHGYARKTGVVLVILFIACLSVANLLFVRGAERARELAVRQAMGAGRWRLLRQLLTENLLLFALGGLGSLVTAKAFLQLLWSFRPPEVAADALRLELDARIWVLTLAASLVVGLVFGLWPALRAARTELVSHLKESEPLAEARGLPHLLQPRSIVVALQVALALVALIGAGLLVRSLLHSLEIDLGFEADHLALVSVAPGEQGYEEAAARAFYGRLLEEARTIPGVAAAGLSQNRLLRGAIIRRQVYLGHEESDDARQFNRVNVIGQGFFDTVGIPLLDGRDFRDQEDGEHRVAIINETMASSLWPDRNAIGQNFHFDYPTTEPIEVIGVVADARYREIHEDKQFFIYLPLSQNPASRMTLHARTQMEPASILPQLRALVRGLDAKLVVTDTYPMKHFVDEALWLERSSASLLTLFGLLALVLALVGVYGLISYSVNNRLREIGIRIALGAGRGRVLGNLLFESLQVVAVGVGAGLVIAALVLKPAMANQLYEVSVVDPPTYAALALVLVLAAMGGSLVPAWRAARTNPNDTLRAE